MRTFLSKSTAKAPVWGLCWSPGDKPVAASDFGVALVVFEADLSLGTGKSVLLREIIKTLRKEYVRTPDAVAVTASTGDWVIHALLL